MFALSAGRVCEATYQYCELMVWDYLHDSIGTQDGLLMRSAFVLRDEFQARCSGTYFHCPSDIGGMTE